VMETLRAATGELYATASGWHTLAGELTGAPPTASGLLFQPSAAAVTAIHAGVAAASGVLAVRTQISRPPQRRSPTPKTRQPRLPCSTC
jgi:hypothetical protein